MKTHGKWEVTIEAKSDVIATEDIIVAELQGERLGIKMSKDDANFIVKAVNLHDGLVAAVKELFGQYHDIQCSREEYDDVCTRIEALLAKVEEINNV